MRRSQGLLYQVLIFRVLLYILCHKRAVHYYFQVLRARLVKYILHQHCADTLAAVSLRNKRMHQHHAPLQPAVGEHGILTISKGYFKTKCVFVIYDLQCTVLFSAKLRYTAKQITPPAIQAARQCALRFVQ